MSGNKSHFSVVSLPVVPFAVRFAWKFLIMWLFVALKERWLAFHPASSGRGGPGGLAPAAAAPGGAPGL